MAKKKAKKAAKKKTSKKKKAKWACPNCGIDHTGKHKKTLTKECDTDYGAFGSCGGFVCECEHETKKEHGNTLEDPCENAVCYHCAWNGQFPQGEKIDYKDLYARKVTEANDYRGYLEHIHKFLQESWEELPDQDDSDPVDRFGDFCPENTETCLRIGRNWCPSLIEELREVLEPGTVWMPADIR